MPNIGEQIQVYKNLKTKLWSVRTRTSKGWRLEGHYDQLTVSNATPHISVKGAERIKNKQSREVVAWIDCYFVSTEASDGGTEVHYNPYRRSDFHYNSDATFSGCAAAFFPPNNSTFFVEL